MSVRIMVVDDSRFVYEDIQRLLANTDFEIVNYCRDGESAVEDYPNVKPDIVTMDIILPEMDGFETAAKIREIDPAARIVFMSSLAYEDTISQAEALGSDFIFKPINREYLMKSLGKLSLEMLDGGANA